MYIILVGVEFVCVKFIGDMTLKIYARRNILIIADLETLQTKVHKLDSISKCVLEIATNRTKAMMFRGSGTIRR